uniref:Uncharacterized protein n=1 Tax=Arundo donax TaxID=35708 RepID=A0A0A9GSR6_ARUDO
MVQQSIYVNIVALYFGMKKELNVNRELDKLRLYIIHAVREVKYAFHHSKILHHFLLHYLNLMVTNEQNIFYKKSDNTIAYLLLHLWVLI